MKVWWFFIKQVKISNLIISGDNNTTLSTYLKSKFDNTSKLISMESLCYTCLLKGCLHELFICKSSLISVHFCFRMVERWKFIIWLNCLIGLMKFVIYYTWTKFVISTVYTNTFSYMHCVCNLYYITLSVPG